MLQDELPTETRETRRERPPLEVALRSPCSSCEIVDAASTTHYDYASMPFIPSAASSYRSCGVFWHWTRQKTIAQCVYRRAFVPVSCSFLALRGSPSCLFELARVGTNHRYQVKACLSYIQKDLRPCSQIINHYTCISV